MIRPTFGLRLGLPGIAFAATLILAACSSADPTVQIQGKVIGPAASGARVCADLDANGLCDPNDPSATAAADGTFTLTARVPLLGSSLLAYVDTSSTLGSRAILRALPDAGGVIGPISTQLAAMVDAGIAYASARRTIAANLGVADALVDADYAASSDALNAGIVRSYSERLLGNIAQLTRVADAAGSSPKASYQRRLVASSPEVAYAWVQFGADADPFSQISIDGVVGGAPADLTRYPVAGTTTYRVTDATAGRAVGVAGQVVRAIVKPAAGTSGSCPTAVVDGADVSMAVRAGTASSIPTYGLYAGTVPTLPANFPVLTCETRLPSTARAVMVNGTPLRIAVPSANVNRIIVMGDTGCRVKGPTAFNQTASGTASGGDPLQDCTDPAVWPFATIARVAASFNPDLVIHNGDLHYREGFPAGTERVWGTLRSYDNSVVLDRFRAARIDDSITFGWRAWEEDFFKATGPLLGAAPWAITRGNHEACDRAGMGWYRFLDPRRFPADEPRYSIPYNASNCSNYTDPLSIQLGDLQVVLLDVAALADDPGTGKNQGWTNGDHIRTARQLTAVAGLPASTDPAKVTWIVTHKPLFAYAGSKAVASNVPQPAFARTWQYQLAIQPGQESFAAGNGRLPSNTQMTLAGHIHGFQMISQPAAVGLPVSFLMGTTGDTLEGLIEQNSGQPHAQPNFGNNILSGVWPWFDSQIGSVFIPKASWFLSTAVNPQNFSSSPITGAGRKETAQLTEFSFMVVDRIAGTRDWKVQVYDGSRRLLRTCTTSGKTATCDG